MTTATGTQAELDRMLAQADSTPGVREVLEVYTPIADMVWAASARPPVYMAYATGGNA